MTPADVFMTPAVKYYGCGYCFDAMLRKKNKSSKKLIGSCKTELTQDTGKRIFFYK